MAEDKRLVLVDDDAHFLDACARSLRMDGHAVRCFGCAEEALESLGRDGADLVLSDLELPAMTGIELLTAMRRRGVPAKFLLMTSFASVESAARVIELGGQGYLVKPFSLGSLSEKVTACLGGPAAEAQTPRLEIRLSALPATADVVLGSALGLILDLLARTLGLEEAAALVADESSGNLVVRVAVGPKRKELLGRRIAPESFPDAGEIAEFPGRRWIPLREDQALIGALLLARHDASRPVSGRELLLARPFAEYAAIAIQSAKALEKLRAAYEDLKIAQQQVVQQEKLSILGRLAAGIVHDLNNPLTAVLGYAQLLRQETPAQDPRLPSIETIEMAALNARGITTNLLAFTKGGDLKFAPLAIHEILRDCVRMIEFRARQAGIDLRLDLAEQPPPVWGNRTQIQQVVLNLCENAIQAMGAQGTITIRTRTQERGQAVEVAISDTGPGVPPGLEDRIFEPFFTTKPPDTGTGLGLSNCRQIMNAHGGDVRLDRQARKGATFLLRFPAPSGGAEKRTPGPRRARILVADDDPSVLGLCRRILETQGYWVTAAAGFQAALDSWSRSVDDGAPIDAAVIDLQLGEESGVSLAAALRERRSGLPVLFVSGQPKLLAEAAAGDGRLAKPFDVAELAAAVTSLLGEKRGRGGT